LEIVANTNILKKFNSIDIFRLDLGNNLKGPAPLTPEQKSQNQFKMKITDTFIKKYLSLNEKIIYKYGEIGSLKFYQDLTIPHHEIHVYHEDEIFEIEFEEPEDGNYRKYLNDLLVYIEEQISKVYTKRKDDDYYFKKNNQRSGKNYTNIPENMEKVDIRLDKDIYVEEMIKRRQKISGGGENAK
jgi:hypothetical protein